MVSQMASRPTSKTSAPFIARPFDKRGELRGKMGERG